MLRTALLAAVAAAALGGAAQAAVTVSFEAPGVQTSTLAFQAKGTESFTGRAGGSFTTDFGGSPYSGRYDNVNVISADQYGGAGGAGLYPVTFSDPGYSLTLTGGPAANSFGFWWSGVDGGNSVELFSRGVSLIKLTGSDIDASAVGADWHYKGNPNAAFLGQDYGERYAYVNLVSDQAWDKVVFSGRGGGFETDNHTVGFLRPAGAVPEPAAWALMITGVALAGGALRRNRAAALRAAAA